MAPFSLARSLRVPPDSNIFFIRTEDDGTSTSGTIISDGSFSVVSFAEDNDVSREYSLFSSRHAATIYTLKPGWLALHGASFLPLTSVSHDHLRTTMNIDNTRSCVPYPNYIFFYLSLSTCRGSPGRATPDRRRQQCVHSALRRSLYIGFH